MLHQFTLTITVVIRQMQAYWKPPPALMTLCRAHSRSPPLCPTLGVLRQTSIVCYLDCGSPQPFDATELEYATYRFNETGSSHKALCQRQIASQRERHCACD